ncbi:MAG: glycoside hydrolase [Actinobacteria bacterium]|nr:glycoside hydrolase [Actinomycetota bacterium]
MSAATLNKAAVAAAVIGLTVVAPVSVSAQVPAPPTPSASTGPDTPVTPAPVAPLPSGSAVPQAPAAPAPGAAASPEPTVRLLPPPGPDDPADRAFPKVEFAEQGVSINRQTAAVQMTKDDLTPARGYSGPTYMLPDPSNSRVIVSATADLRSRVCKLTRSTDAGLTWSILDALPAPEGYPFCTSGVAGVAQSPIAFGSDGTLYYALLAYGEGEGARNGNVSLALARSTDLGDSWSTTLVTNNRGPTGTESEPAPTISGVTGLAVDTSGDEDVVHVGFNPSFVPRPAGDSPLSNSRILVATSTDGGASFGEPVDVNGFAKLTETVDGEEYPLIMTSSFGRPLMFAREGVLLAVADARTPFDVEIPNDNNNYPALPLLVGRSTDQGKTWTVEKLGPPVYTGTGAMTGLKFTPEGGGTIVAAYAATPGDATTSGTADIVMQRSTDNGLTWSEPLAIDDDKPAENSNSFYPQMGVAPNGRIDVVWQDNRGLADFRINVRYTYSTDGGLTWAPNVLVTDQPIDFNLGISFNSDIRQPPGVASTDAYAAIGWADGRLGDQTTRTQDGFSSVAQFAPLPAEGSLLAKLAAGFGGLLLAGLIIVLFVLLRRRQGPPSTSTGAKHKQPVAAG